MSSYHSITNYNDGTATGNTEIGHSERIGPAAASAAIATTTPVTANMSGASATTGGTYGSGSYYYDPSYWQSSSNVVPSSLSNEYDAYGQQQHQQQQMMTMMTGATRSNMDEDTMLASHIAKSIVDQIIQEENDPLISFVNESKHDEQFANRSKTREYEKQTNPSNNYDYLQGTSISGTSVHKLTAVTNATSNSISSGGNKRSRWGPPTTVPISQQQQHEQHLVESQRRNTTNAPHVSSAVPGVTTSTLHSSQHHIHIYNPERTFNEPTMSSTNRSLDVLMGHHHNRFEEDLSSSIATESNARSKREQYFQKLDIPRKHAALIRNFEYIHEKEELKLKQQLNQLEKHKNKEVPVNQRQVLSKKGQALLTSKAGLGTQKRNLAVKTFDKVSGLVGDEANNSATSKNRQSAINKDNNDNKEKDKRASFYITGLTPTTNKETIEHLFQSFGPVERVTLYKNKATGRLKGDALVVFRCATSNSIQQDSTTSSTSTIDVDAICQQIEKAGATVFTG